MYTVHIRGFRDSNMRSPVELFGVHILIVPVFFILYVTQDGPI